MPGLETIFGKRRREDYAVLTAGHEPLALGDGRMIKRLVADQITAEEMTLLLGFFRGNQEHLKPFVPWLAERYTRLPTLTRDLAKPPVKGMAQYSGLDPSGRIFGYFALYPPRLVKSDVAVGYVIDKDYTNQGLATESAAAMAGYVFGVLGKTAMAAEIDVGIRKKPGNLASLAVASKVGFEQYTSYLTYSYGRFRHIGYFRLEREDFEANHPDV